MTYIYFILASVGCILPIQSKILDLRVLKGLFQYLFSVWGLCDGQAGRVWGVVIDLAYSATKWILLLIWDIKRMKHSASLREQMEPFYHRYYQLRDADV